jgi:tRNA(His) 5'-end guanylyltransferase
MKQSMDKKSLGDRMKEYEKVWKFILPKRMPIIIRLDGKAFHTFTRKFNKPFDTSLIDMMDKTALYICQNIQGAELAYVQSDEISILIHYYKTINTEPWFANEVQKIVSISSALASSYFTYELNIKNILSVNFPIQFDSRVFILPEDEVCNYFIWRQQDWERNSIQMVGQSLFSHKELLNKNNSNIQEMCFQKGVNWNDLENSLKRGRCLFKIDSKNESNIINKKEWYIEKNIPIFTQDRDFINIHLQKED